MSESDKLAHADLLRGNYGLPFVEQRSAAEDEYVEDLELFFAAISLDPLNV